MRVRPVLCPAAVAAVAALSWALLAACGAAGAPPGAAPGPTATNPAPGQPGTPAAAYPLTITDGLGRQVRLEREPQRLISYLPSNTETLYALGLGDRVVGVDDFSDYPEAAKAKPKLGGLQVNLEALVALQPDLVLTVGRTPDFPTLLEPHKIPVVVMEYRDVAGTLANVELLGKVVGKPAEAAKLVAELRARMEMVRAKTAAAPVVRVYYELDGTDPAKPYTAGPGSFIDDLITLGGGANIAAGATGQAPQLSVEEIVRADPQLIVVPVGPYSPPDATSPERFARRPGWEQIDAVKNQRVRGVDSALVSRPGPRLADGLEAIARAIHPDLFR